MRRKNNGGDAQNRGLITALTPGRFQWKSTEGLGISIEDCWLKVLMMHIINKS